MLPAVYQAARKVNIYAFLYPSVRAGVIRPPAAGGGWKGAQVRQPEPWEDARLLRGTEGWRSPVAQDQLPQIVRTPLPRSE